jgi:capsular exopolysaccharide synthesis family protein
MLSLLLGLTLGLGVAYVMERLDDRIRTVEDVESISGLATLGIIPHVGNEASMDEEFGDANSAISEAYRSLCTSLQFSTEHGAPRVIFITSAGPSEGKSLTAIAIARYFGALGNQVLLIDADLRKPSLHEKLGHDNSLGLSNYLTGHAEAPDTFQTSMYKNVAFMASGVLPPNAADLVVSKRMHTLLKVGADVFDIIVIDGPPVMGIADAPLLANIAEATVFIVGAGQVRAAQLRDALRRIDFSKGNLIGTVLTKFDAKSAGYGYGSGYAYGGYGYGYGYGRNDKVRPPLTDHSADRNRRDEAA